jgi:hypothetical protein
MISTTIDFHTLCSIYEALQFAKDDNGQFQYLSDMMLPECSTHNCECIVVYTKEWVELHLSCPKSLIYKPLAQSVSGEVNHDDET